MAGPDPRRPGGSTPEGSTIAKPANPWAHFGCEPHINDMLNDSIVRMMMKKDKISDRDILSIVEYYRRNRCH